MNDDRLPLSEEVFNQIVVHISEGDWVEGEKLPSESQLCEMFHVSRISVRAALQKLKGQGLITTKPGVGSFVCRPERDSDADGLLTDQIAGEAFREFFEFRQAIEFKAIELFVIHATKSDEEELKRALDGMLSCGEDRERFALYDRAFHMAIIRGSKNSFLYNAMESLEPTHRSYLEEVGKLTKKSNAQRYREHKKLYEMLLQKKPGIVKERILDPDMCCDLSRY